jgi:site-specific DNA-methyltransferase (adenine-specific)
MATRPYYENGSVRLYLGDCQTILPELFKHDLLLTDPPYGIGDIWQGGKGHGWNKADKVKCERNRWDERPPTADELGLALTQSREAIIWGGNYFGLRPSRGWLVWVKPERNFTLAEAEVAWTSRDSVIRVCELPRSETDRCHPTQKPVALMTWCLSLFPYVKTVLDPYAGSGTTLVAAKLMGLGATGIEIHEPYAEYAAQRLDQGILDFQIDRNRTIDHTNQRSLFEESINGLHEQTPLP